MFRFVEIELPTDSSRSDPVETVIDLGRGKITRWWAGFEPGCGGLAHVTIYHHEHQIIPKGEGESLYWDDFVFVIPDTYYLIEVPYAVKVRAWNDGTKYDRKVVVGVTIEPIPTVTTEGLLQRLLRALAGE